MLRSVLSHSWQRWQVCCWHLNTSNILRAVPMPKWYGLQGLIIIIIIY
jgi:hypothetical protein